MCFASRPGLTAASYVILKIFWDNTVPANASCMHHCLPNFAGAGAELGLSGLSQQPCPAHGPAALQEVTFASLALESTSASPLQMKLSASLGKHAGRPSGAQQLFFLLFHTRALFQGKEKLGETGKCSAGAGRGSWICSSWLRPFWIDAALKLCGSHGVLS